MRKLLMKSAIFLSFGMLLATPRDLPAQENSAASTPDLTVPSGADVDSLKRFVLRAKATVPSNGNQYKLMQEAVRDASRQILQLLRDQPESADYLQAELDSLTASVALMTFNGAESQKKTLDQVLNFLKSRKELSLKDVQTGMMAATMLELQPNKKPARSVYETLDELLVDDKRPAMQSLRVNLQANLRRLDLLGNKMELKATALDGRQVHVDDYAGKFLIVDFFASWSKPCLEEAPRLKRHYEKYRDKGLEVVSISVDQDKQAMMRHLEKVNYPWPVIHDAAEDPLKTLRIQFGVSSLPTIMLLNKEGTVVSLEARGRELDRLVEMLFAAPTLAPARSGETSSEKPTEGSSPGN